MDASEFPALIAGPGYHALYVLAERRSSFGAVPVNIRSEPVSRIQLFLAELRRRKVWHVAVAYLLVGAVLVGAANDVLPRLALPEWTVTFVVVLTLLGFPIAILLAWAYDLQPDQTAHLDRSTSASDGLRSASDLPATVEQGRAEDSRPIDALANSDQDIKFCTTSDGVRIAYSTVGDGPFMVRVLGHFTHLEAEWEWPELRRLWQQLAEEHTLVRYDGRGIGLSDPYPNEFTEETRQLDLDAVLDAVGAKKAVLLGVSEGGWTAATYATQHPERITHIILYGAYCRGARARPGHDREEDEALVTLIRKGWGRDTPEFRQLFTSQFFRSDADPELIAHFNELQRLAADPDTAARYHESCHRRGDGRELFGQLKIPTLVIHSLDDLAVSAEEGRLLASIIPGANLVLLPSGTHYFPTDAGVATKVTGAIDRFLNGAEQRS